MPPSTAITTDSHRTMRRICRRDMPDDPQEPELAGALEHRQRERVDDPEDGDDLRQRQDRDQHGEELVDLRLLVVAELGRG